MKSEKLLIVAFVLFAVALVPLYLNQSEPEVVVFDPGFEKNEQTEDIEENDVVDDIDEEDFDEPDDSEENENSEEDEGVVISAPMDAMNIALQFYTDEDLATASYEANHRVIRMIERTPKVADAALRELFKGPTPAEAANGANTMDALSALGEYYRGVAVYKSFPSPYPNREQSYKNAAVVKFSGPAMQYLNAAAGTQFMLKAAIEATLMNFRSVDTVFYEIDDELFIKWDA